LHFSVFKAKDGKHRQTIPIRYRTAEDFGIVLQEGKAYKAAGLSALVAGATSKASRIETSETKEADSRGAHGGSGLAVGH
jgi:hypothetical protein